MKLYRLFRHKKYGESIVPPMVEQVWEDDEEEDEDDNMDEEEEEKKVVMRHLKRKRKLKQLNNDLHTVIEEESLNESEILPHLEQFSEEDHILSIVLESLAYEASLILSD
jgi:hypothetical protein